MGLDVNLPHDYNDHCSQTLNEASKNMREANLFVVNLPEPLFPFLALCWCCWNVSVSRQGLVECMWHIQSWTWHVNYLWEKYSSSVFLMLFFPYYQLCLLSAEPVEIFSPNTPPPWNFNTIEYYTLLYILYVYLYPSIKKSNLSLLNQFSFPWERKCWEGMFCLEYKHFCVSVTCCIEGNYREKDKLKG